MNVILLARGWGSRERNATHSRTGSRGTDVSRSARSCLKLVGGTPSPWLPNDFRARLGCTVKRTSLTEPVTSPSCTANADTMNGTTNNRDVTSRTNSFSGSSSPTNLSRRCSQDARGCALARTTLALSTVERETIIVNKDVLLYRYCYNLIDEIYKYYPLRLIYFHDPIF